MRKLIKRFETVLEIFQKHHLNASAAHAAFFIMLSFIPCIILLFSLLQFTSIEKIDVLTFFQNVVPTGMLTFVTTIVGEAYGKTATTVSLSAVAALWSAGCGMMALTQGLQSVAEIKETRNYFAVRLRGTLYTVVLLLSIIAFLLLGVFGNSMMEMLVMKFPVTIYVVNVISGIKNIFLILFTAVLFTLLFRFMPGNEMPLNQHLPGAIITSIGWFVYSYAFSVYVEKFSGFSNMYGSLTTIVLIMLWLYFGMYMTLIGAEVNQMLAKIREKT